jgi:MFS family permease
MAVGGLIVPKLNIILSLVCRRYLDDKSAADPSYVFVPVLLGEENPQCRKIPEVQSLATDFMLYITVIAGTLSAVTTPKLGALSDRYGRKRLLVISSFGLFLSEIITIIAFKYPDAVSYKWLLSGAVFDGICGSFTCTMAITYAYASDCTAPPKRAVAFGYFHACLFLGIALGPLAAALLLKFTGSLISIFYVTLGIHAFFISFILLVVPDSLSKKRLAAAQDKFAAERESVVSDDNNWAWALRQSNILEPLKILWPTTPGSSSRLRSNLVLLSAVDTTVFGVAMGSLTVVVYYSGFRFGWDTGTTSEFVSAVNICRVTVLLVFLPLINQLVRRRRANRQLREFGFIIPDQNSGSDVLDLNVIRGAIFLEIIGYAGYSLAHTGALFAASGAIAALGGIGSPILQSALTKHVPHDKVGQLLGASGLLHALARIISPTVFNLIYSTTVGTLPQTVFIALTACFVLAFTGSWFIRPNGESRFLSVNGYIGMRFTNNSASSH